MMVFFEVLTCVVTIVCLFLCLFFMVVLLSGAPHLGGAQCRLIALPKPHDSITTCSNDSLRRANAGGIPGVTEHC